jgi:hypothetical protein
VPGPVIIVLVLVLVLDKCFTQRVWSTIDASSGLFRHCIPNPRSMSRTRTTTRTRTIARRGGARFSSAIRRARSGATSWLEPMVQSPSNRSNNMSSRNSAR